MARHDNSYKLLFSEPSMVRDLLLGYVREDWVERLDFNSLEKVSGSYVSDDLKDREDDIIWRVRWGDEWLYVYLLLEFQSTIDPFMAVRVMAYEALLYQDLIRQKALCRNGNLPPILPIVLYNGERRWNAACDVAELVEDVPGGLSRFRPSLTYLLLDEQALVSQESLPAATHNLVTTLFKLERQRHPEQWVDLIRQLAEWLNAPEHASLRRAFTVWIRRVLLSSRLPNLDNDEINALQDLHEVNHMLAENIKRWPEYWREDARREGLKEGREQGLEQGLEQGRRQGQEQATLETACNLITQTSLDDATIASATGLNLRMVETLRQSLQD